MTDTDLFNRLDSLDIISAQYRPQPHHSERFEYLVQSISSAVICSYQYLCLKPELYFGKQEAWTTC
jgi:hypothetical protein